MEEDYSRAIQDYFLCVPEGQEMIAYAERQGHRVKQDAEGKLAANFFAEANPLGGTERTGALRARIAAKKLGYRLKPYLAAGRPYVLLVAGDPSPWQAGLWQVCPELRDPGNYLVKIAKGALLTNVEEIAGEQEYLSRYGPKMARMRVLSLLEKVPLRASPPTIILRRRVSLRTDKLQPRRTAIWRLRCLPRVRHLPRRCSRLSIGFTRIPATPPSGDWQGLSSLPVLPQRQCRRRRC